MKLFLLAISAIVMGLPSLVWANDTDNLGQHIWQLSKINGKAWIEATNKEPMLVRRNRQLFPGQTLSTANRTRLQLSRGKERIQVGSNTLLSLPGASELSPGNTIIRQKTGTLHLWVNKKNVTHFAVHTPYLVAAVKGTRFSIQINKQSASVRVQEGVVQVKNRLATEIANVKAGQSVTMNVATAMVPTATMSHALPTHMTILGRGEERPEVVADRARKRAEAQRYSGFTGGFLRLVTEATAAIVGAVGDAINAVITVATAMVMSFLTPLFGATQDAGTLSHWLRLLLAASAMGLVAGLGIIYFTLRRKRS